LIKQKKKSDEKSQQKMIRASEKKKSLLDQILKSEVAISIIVNLIFLLTILVFCDIKYEVSDDFVMSAIMSGAYDGTPNPHLIFINILWGYMLLPFYYLCPQISWYLVFQILLCFLSMTLISYMLLEKLDHIMAFMIIVLFLTVFGSDAYILVQFTKTAVLAVMGGGSVFVWSLFEEKGMKITGISGIVCLCGTMIRFNVVYIAGGFILFILVFNFIKFIKLNRKDNLLTKKIVMIAMMGLVLIVTSVTCKEISSYIYKTNNEYRFFKEYSKARADIVDASDYGYAAYAEELEKIGVSENDYKMMRSWNFADNEVFSLETMQKTAQVIAEYKKTVGVSKEKILEEIQNRGLQGYPVCIACIVITILGIVFQRERYWTSFIIWGIGFFYILYFFGIERTVYRTEYAVFLCGFLGIIYFWNESGKIERKEQENICKIIIALGVILQLPLYIPDRSYQDVYSDNRREYIENTFYESWNYNACKYRKNVNKGNKSENLLNEIETHKENLYLLDFQTTMQVLYYEWNPYKTLPEGYFDNSVYLASVMTNFPACNNILENYHAKQPLKALVNDNVYLIDTEWRTLNQKVQFLQEHYYPNVRAELYKEIDGYQIWKFYKN